ncbi:hypothetical protein K431DRAFT_198845, partial [Polychaeton citri CBS 116435]
SAQKIISTYGINDAFLPDLIGRPNYWAPYVLYNKIEATYEFHCQHPRWQPPQTWDYYRKRQRAPSSIYMKHFGRNNLTVYIVAAAPNDTCITFLRDQLHTPNNPNFGMKRLKTFASNTPFLLHSAISSVVVEQSKDFVHDVRKTLMNQINKSDDGVSGRAKLEAITKNLHLVSQKADTGISNAEKSIENCEYMLGELRRFSRYFPSTSPDPLHEASMRYTLNVWRCQKRLLASYKARKETSMNLVFNLVTQQDSKVNVDISSSMLADSTSMKTIAVLTMVFLPGTFLSGLFGSGVFVLDDNKDWSFSSLFGLFWYCLIPLTLVVIILW